MQLTAFGKTDQGRERQYNQDRILCLDDIGAFVVADGMGGAKGGEIASTTACQVIDFCLHQARKEAGWIWPPFWSRETYDEALSLEANIINYSIDQAHYQIQHYAQNNEGYENMGTTVVMALFHGDCCYMAHVGDSRAYVLRDGQLNCLTWDHTWVHAKIWSGEITEQEAREHPMRNLLWQSLGGQSIQVEHGHQQLLPGDIFLLCSDGVTEMLTDKEVRNLIIGSGRNPDKASSMLVDAANAKGGRDNIAALIVRVDAL